MNRNSDHLEAQFPAGAWRAPIYNAPSLDEVVSDVRELTKAEKKAITVTALCVMATSVQGVFDVELPIGKVVPLSIMGLVIAGSGERKSSIENVLMRGVRSFQLEKTKEEVEKVEDWKERHGLWVATMRKMRNAISTAESRGVDAAELIDRLLEHKNKEPKSVQESKVVYEDSTPEALFGGLSNNGKSVILASSEGGVLLNSKALQDTPKLNSIWSGDSIVIDRKGDGRLHVEGARLSAMIMAQSSVLERYLGKARNDPRGTGFLSRFLVCAPQSMCGSRFVDGVSVKTPSLDAFVEKTKEFLRLSYEAQGDRGILTMSTAAQRAWIAIANSIEREMAPGGRLSNATDHGSKLPENIARVAAVIHCFESAEGNEISESTLRAAAELCALFSEDFLRVFNAPPEYVFNAMELEQWFIRQAGSGLRYVRKNIAMQFGPRCIRKKGKLDDAIDHLVSNGRVGFFPHGRISVIDLYPVNAFDGYKLAQDLSL